MKDQEKAEQIAEQRIKILSPLLEEGLDAAKAREIKARICEQTGMSERTLRRYLAQYRNSGFSGLKPKERGRQKTEDAIPPHLWNKQFYYEGRCQDAVYLKSFRF